MKWVQVVLLGLIGMAGVGCQGKGEHVTEREVVLVKTAQLEPNQVPIGILGYRIGEYLTLEGVKEKGVFKAGGRLVVEKINGEVLAKPIAIGLQNVSLPDDQRVVVKGCEIFQIYGNPADYWRKKEMGEPVSDWSLAQRGGKMSECHVSHGFVVVKVVTPVGLKIQEAEAKDPERLICGLVEEASYWGMPLGELVTVEGKVGELAGERRRYLTMVKVNGVEVRQVKNIRVDSLDFSPGAVVTVKGYMRVAMAGVAAAEQAMEGAGKGSYLPIYEFVVMEVVKPREK